MTTIMLWAAVGFFGVAAQSAVSFFKKPNWTKEDVALDENWRRLAIYSGLAGILALAMTLTLVLTVNLTFYLLAITGPVMFVAFQSFITDLRLRYVDRWIMRIANAMALALGVYLMLTYRPEAEVVIYAIFAVIATAIIFMPGIGDSDGRAFQLLVFTLYPFYGTAGIQLGLIGMIIFLFGYYVILSIIKKNWNIKALFTKMSFPMVPLIVTPVFIVLLLGRWLPSF